MINCYIVVLGRHNNNSVIQDSRGFAWPLSRVKYYFKVFKCRRKHSVLVHHTPKRDIEILCVSTTNLVMKYFS